MYLLKTSTIFLILYLENALSVFGNIDCTIAQHMRNSYQNQCIFFKFQVCGITDREFTYHQLYKYSRILATRLRQHFKLKNCDVICVMLPNLPEYPLVVLGGLQAGVVVTTINPIYTAREISFLFSFNIIGVKYLIVI